MKRADELRKKADFVAKLSTVLAEEPGSGVEYIEYDEDFEGGLEVVTIHYYGGGIARINVTINSCGAIYKEIGAEVYGVGAAGRMHEK